MDDTDTPLPACLAPWFDVFRDLNPAWHTPTTRCILDAHCAAASLPPRILWVGRGYDSSLPISRYCEAASLLTLLGQVDAVEWRNTLNWFWPSLKRHIDEELFSRKEPVVVGVREDLIGEPAELAPIEDFICGLDEATRSVDFIRAVELLAPRLPDKQRRVHLLVPLRFDLCRDELGVARRVIEAQYSTQTANASDPTASVAPAPRFLVNEVVLKDFPPVYRYLNHSELNHLHAIQKCGVRPSLLLPLDDDTSMRKTRSIACLRSLVALDSETPRSLGADTTYVVAGESTPMLLSALQHSPSIETVEIQRSCVEDETLQLPWGWIAYSLFSKYATHKIQSLTIDMRKFQGSDFHEIKAVLSTKNPLVELIPDAQPDLGQLSASRYCMEDPTNCAPQDVKFWQSSVPVVVPIVSSPTAVHPMWWRVWLPGCGDAWVHTQDIHSRIAPQDMVTRKTPVSFARINIAFLSAEMSENMLNLLMLIGHGTKKLILRQRRWKDDEILHSWLLRVFHVCPQLEDMVVCWPIQWLQVFVTGATNDHIKLRRLSCWHIHVSDLDDAISFFHALADPTHPLTAHLQQLNLIFQHPPVDLLDLIVDAAVAMLDTNRSLIKVYLKIYHRGSYAHVNGLFSKHPKNPVIVRTGPLPLQSKLAFLSVPLLLGLDSHAVSSIFQFAAATAARQVTMEQFRTPPSSTLGNEDESNEQQASSDADSFTSDE